MIVDICLSDAEFLLHTKLNRKSVGVPTSLAMHLETLHRLISVEGVLDRTGKHMMNARMSIGRRRSLEEYELRASLLFIY